MAKRSATAKRTSHKPKVDKHLRPLAQAGNGTPSRLSDREKFRLLVRMAGEPVRVLRAEVKAKDKRDAKIDQWLKTRRRHRCFVLLELFDSVELDCHGCSSQKGKFRLLQRALKKLGEEHGVLADLHRDWVHCAVFDGNVLVFAVKSSPLAWEPVLNPDARGGVEVKPENAINVHYFELPPGDRSYRRNGTKRGSRSRRNR